MIVQKCGNFNFCQQVVSFLLSHIGLLSLVVGYCIMGAFVFEELERDHELMVKKSMTKNRWALSVLIIFNNVQVCIQI